MVSSGIYRYVASRDELLTLLIIEAYDALGAAVEGAVAATAAQPPAGPLRRRGPRDPRAGRSPTRTSTPSSTARRCPATPPRPTRSGPAVAGRRWPSPASSSTPTGPGSIDPPADRRRSTSRRRCGPTSTGAARRSTSTCPTTSSSRLLAAWTQLFGLVSFELFGQTAQRDQRPRRAPRRHGRRRWPGSSVLRLRRSPARSTRRTRRRRAGRRGR